MPETRVSLIMRLPRSADGVAWREFVELYEPLVYRFARGRGLHEHDAQELVQRVLVAVAGSVHRWQPDPDRGSFRSWLFRIARNQLIKQVTSRAREKSVGGTSHYIQMHHNLAESHDFNQQQIEQEYRQAIFEQAAAVVRQAVLPQTWQAFHLSSIEELPFQQVAEQLNMTVGAVYIARSRVIARLRETVQKLEAADALQR